MTDLHKECADFIIDFLKSRNGTQYNRESILGEVDQKVFPLQDARYVLNILLYNKLVAPAFGDEDYYLFLTEKGWAYVDYKTFEEQREKDANKEKRQISTTILNNKTSIANAITTFIIGIIVLIIQIRTCNRDDIKEHREIQKTAQESIMQQNKALRDSLYETKELRLLQDSSTTLQKDSSK